MAASSKLLCLDAESYCVIAKETEKEKKDLEARFAAADAIYQDKKLISVIFNPANHSPKFVEHLMSNIIKGDKAKALHRIFQIGLQTPKESRPSE